MLMLYVLLEGIVGVKKMSKSYSELILLNSFKERFEYLRLSGTIGQETFGFDRYINQRFYQSKEWKRVRDIVIIRDGGCDLGVEGYEIRGKIFIHHINPIEVSDIVNRKDLILNPEFLICVSHDTHNAIHYGDETLLSVEPIIRSENDTCLWK